MKTEAKRIIMRLFGIDEIVRNLEEENAKLKMALEQKGNIFFKDQKWLGRQMSAYGTVIDGELIAWNAMDLQPMTRAPAATRD